jgi:hypothetical protein
LLSRRNARALRSLPIALLALTACGSEQLAPVTPQSQSVATAIAAPQGARQTMYDGCPVFARHNYAYNGDLSNRPVDPNSAAYIASLADFTTGWDNDTAEYLNTADSSTQVMRVVQQVWFHRMPAQPWQPGFRIEDKPDAHSFVLDTSSCHIYELYNTHYFGGITLSAYSGGNWALNGPYIINTSGEPTAVASGLSMFAGAVKWTELASGRITHTLFLIAPNNSLSQWNYVQPASDTGQIPYRGRAPMQLPYGAKLRLRANFPTTGLGPQALTVVAALQRYGAIIGDTGGAWKFVYMNDLRYANAFDFFELDALRIAPGDWQVVKLPPVRTIPHRDGRPK